MENVDERLKKLQHELQETEAGIANAETSLQADQDKLKQLTAKRTALQPFLGEINAGRSAVAKQREAAAEERKKAEKSQKELLTLLEGQLSQKHRDDIAAAIKAVDDEIDELQQKVWDLKKQVAEAEQEAARAKDEANTLNAQFRMTQAELRQLATQIAAAQSPVTRLKADAKKAADNKRPSDAFLLVSALKQALDALQKEVDSQKEDEILSRYVQQWQDLPAVNDKATKMAAALDQLKRDLAAAEQQLQQKAQGREEAIRGKIRTA